VPLSHQQERLVPTLQPEPSDDLRDEVRWLYHNGAIYDDILAYYADYLDNATLAQLLDDVHLVDSFVLRRSVRTLLALRRAGAIPTSRSGRDSADRPTDRA
jgi:hypothetical protein